MRHKTNKKKHSGSALVLAVTMVIILALMGIGLVRLGLNARMQGVKDVLQISARAAADSGMIDAERRLVNWWKYVADKSSGIAVSAYLAANAAPKTDQLTDTYGNAGYSYTVTSPSGIGVADLTSTGIAGNVTRIVHAKLDFFSNWEAMGVKDTIDIGVGGGLYTIPADKELIIHSNTNDPRGIVFRQGIHVPGNVYIGTEGDPDEVIDAKNNVTSPPDADWDSAPENMEFPSQNPPSYILGTTITAVPDDTDPNVYILDGLEGVWNGVLDIKAKTQPDRWVLKIMGNNGQMTDDETGELVFDSQGQVVYEPLNILITGDTTIGGGAEGGTLLIGTDSAVNIYLGGSLDAKKGSFITYEGMPENPDPVGDQALIIQAARSLTLYGTDTCT